MYLIGMSKNRHSSPTHRPQLLSCFFCCDIQRSKVQLADAPAGLHSSTFTVYGLALHVVHALFCLATYSPISSWMLSIPTCELAFPISSQNVASLYRSVIPSVLCSVTMSTRAPPRLE